MGIVMAERPMPDMSDLRAERDAWAQAAFESERFAAQLAIERQHLRDAFDTLQAKEREAARADMASAFDAALRERDAAVADRDALAAERDRAIVERDRARGDAHDAAAMLDRVTSSTAWRLTGPVRRLLQALRRR